MKWIYDGHKEALRAAIQRTQSMDKAGRISREYGAALYILTGMEYTWPRLKKHTGSHSIDCAGMLEMGLSRGEALVVGLAGNLFNGRTYVEFAPVDLADHLDNAMYRLVLEGMRLRRADIDPEELRE